MTPIDITMKIIGDHPHTGELCKPTLQRIMVGVFMYEVQLLNCEHGIDRCYVERSNLRVMTGQEEKAQE